MNRCISQHSHLPSSFRQISLLSTALTMTSSVSPALIASSFPLHFLLVSVWTTVTWYSTCISPSYWKSLKMTTQVAIKGSNGGNWGIKWWGWLKYNKVTNFELFPEVLFLLFKFLLLLWVHFFSPTFAFHRWKALKRNKQTYVGAE